MDGRFADTFGKPPVLFKLERSLTSLTAPLKLESLLH